MEVAKPTVVLSSDVLDSLRELQSEDDPHFLANLMTLFLSSLNSKVAMIGKVSRSGDAKILASEAHALKSSSGNVGATVLSDLCESLERLGKTGVTEGSGPVVILLDQESARVCAAIAELPEMKAFVASQAA